MTTDIMTTASRESGKQTLRDLLVNLGWTPYALHKHAGIAYVTAIAAVKGIPVKPQTALAVANAMAVLQKRKLIC